MGIYLTSFALFKASAKAAFASAGFAGGGTAFPVKDAILKYSTREKIAETKQRIAVHAGIAMKKAVPSPRERL